MSGLVINPPHKLFARLSSMPKDLEGIRSTLKQCDAFNNPLLVRLDDSLLQQSRDDVRLSMILQEFILSFGSTRVLGALIGGISVERNSHEYKNAS